MGDQKPPGWAEGSLSKDDLEAIRLRNDSPDVAALLRHIETLGAEIGRVAPYLANHGVFGYKFGPVERLNERGEYEPA